MGSFTKSFQQKIPILVKIAQKQKYIYALGPTCVSASNLRQVFFGGQKYFQQTLQRKLKHTPSILTFSELVRHVILPVVLYGCETWSLTLREEGRLRVF